MPKVTIFVAALLPSPTLTLPGTTDTHTSTPTATLTKTPAPDASSSAIYLPLVTNGKYQPSGTIALHLFQFLSSVARKIPLFPARQP